MVKRINKDEARKYFIEGKNIITRYCLIDNPRIQINECTFLSEKQINIFQGGLLEGYYINI